MSVGQSSSHRADALGLVMPRDESASTSMSRSSPTMASSDGAFVQASCSSATPDTHPPSSLSSEKRSKRLSRESRPAAEALGSPTFGTPARESSANAEDSRKASSSNRLDMPSLHQQSSPSTSPTKLPSSRVAIPPSFDPATATSLPHFHKPQRRATHDAAGPSMLPSATLAMHVQVPIDLDIDDEKNAGSTGMQSIDNSRARGVLGHDRRRSLSPKTLADSIPEINPESQSAQYQSLQRATSLSSSWTHRARRWSNSFSQGRGSTALAKRLAEGASPYLRAGIEELRSIFDVDSNPIPPSPFEDDDSSIEDTERCATFSDFTRGSGHSETTLQLPQDDNILVASKATQGAVIASSPLSASPQNVTPPSTAHSHSRSLFHRSSSAEKRARGSRDNVDRDEKLSPTFKSQRNAYSALTPMREEPMPLGVSTASTRPLIAWGLLVIAIGLTALCAWGYATQSDIFSSTLVGFFMAQPGFALAALVSLMLRKRALMDLSSRAMRAHVLAQSIIVILAYLDLSASSIYSVRRESIRGGVSAKAAFRILPSMEMKFGPLHAPTEAGSMSTLLMGERLSRSRAGQTVAQSVSRAFTSANAGASSLHAHETHVGDWQSRLTHLVVFLVQGAIPIVLVLVGQYVIAQRLATLARRSSISRQLSERSVSGSSSPLPKTNADLGREKLQQPSGSLAIRRASKSQVQGDPLFTQRANSDHLAPPSHKFDASSRRRHPTGKRLGRRPNTSDGTLAVGDVSKIAAAAGEQSYIQHAQSATD